MYLLRVVSGLNIFAASYVFDNIEPQSLRASKKFCFCFILYINHLHNIKIALYILIKKYKGLIDVNMFINNI